MTGTNGGRKARCSTKVCLVPWELGAETEERPQDLVCSRDGDATRRLNLEERRESEEAHLLPWPS